MDITSLFCVLLCYFHVLSVCLLVNLLFIIKNFSVFKEDKNIERGRNFCFFTLLYIKQTISPQAKCFNFYLYKVLLMFSFESLRHFPLREQWGFSVRWLKSFLKTLDQHLTSLVLNCLSPSTRDFIVMTNQWTFSS